MRWYIKHTWNSARWVSAIIRMSTADSSGSSLRTGMWLFHLFVFQWVKHSALQPMGTSLLNISTPGAAQGPDRSEWCWPWHSIRVQKTFCCAMHFPFICWIITRSRGFWKRVSDFQSMEGGVWLPGQCYFPTCMEIFQYFNNWYACSAVYKLTTLHRVDPVILIKQT